MRFKNHLRELENAVSEKTHILTASMFPDMGMKFVRGGNHETQRQFNKLANFFMARGWYVQTTNSRNEHSYGWCDHRRREIYVRPSYKNQMLFNLIHEGAHALELEKTPFSLLELRGLYDAEVIAESTAYVVAKELGLGGDLLLRSSHYLAAWRLTVLFSYMLPIDYEKEITELASTILTVFE